MMVLTSRQKNARIIVELKGDPVIGQHWKGDFVYQLPDAQIENAKKDRKGTSSGRLRYSWNFDENSNNSRLLLKDVTKYNTTFNGFLL